MSKGKEPQSRIAGRDARTGQFIPVQQTYSDPAHTVRERLPLPGYGDTNRGKGDNGSKK